MKTAIKYCRHCWPTKRKHHLDTYLDYYVERLGSPLQKLLNQPIFGHFWPMLLRFLAFFKLVTFEDDPDESKIFNRSLIFFKEAKKRKIDIKIVKILGRYKNDFCFKHRGRTYFYESLPTFSLSDNSQVIDDKFLSKKILEANNIPVPPGKLFTSRGPALRYAETTGYPLVVKPNRGSLSYHSTYPIKTDTELDQAIVIARRFRPDFIVEKFINGSLFRASVVGKKHVFVCKKEKPNVVGDGLSTIEQLIKMKNQDQRRGEINQKNFTLHQVPLDHTIKYHLAAQGISLNSVPSAGKTIYLHNKAILSFGCDIINHTELTHPENKELFLKIANILDADLIGIDIIMADVSKPFHEQESAVIETNSVPYIDMHQVPSSGSPDPVARVVWDLVLERLGS